MSRNIYKILSLTFTIALFTGACATMKTDEMLQKASAHYRLGLSYLNDNNIQPAFVEFQKAIELDPTNKEILNALGVVYLMKLEDYPKAIEFFRKALQADGSYAEASNNLGIAYEKTGRFREAIEAYKTALANPFYINSEKAFNNLGRAYYRDRQYADAISAYKEALKRFPDFHQPYYGLALCYNATGKYGDAALAIKRAYELDPAYKGNRAKAIKDMREQKLIIKNYEEKDIEDLLEIMNY